MRRRALAVLAAAAVGLFGSTPLASATPITFVEKVTGTGLEGTTVFTNVQLTFDIVANTASITCTTSPHFCSGPATMTTVSGSGITTAFLTDPIDVIDNANFGGMPVAGFGVHGAPFLLAIDNAAFSTYDLQSSIGPVGGLPVSFLPTVFNTPNGPLVLEDLSVDGATYQASTVPEPGTLVLLGSGLVALRARRRMRR